MQKIFISGVLGADALSKEVGESIAINFSVAVNEKHGEKEVTSWYACTIWRNKEKAGITQYLKKGTGVIIEGTPEVEVWLGKEKNEPQGQIKITVRDLDFMSGNAKKAETPATE